MISMFPHRPQADRVFELVKQGRIIEATKYLAMIGYQDAAQQVQDIYKFLKLISFRRLK